MVNVQNTNRKCYMLRAGPLLVSNRGDKQSRFLTLYLKARTTRYFKARTTRFLITHPLSITKPVSGFSKSVHALGSGHLFLLRRDNTIWNRVLFGIGRAFLEKAALVDLRGYGAPHLHLFVVARDDVDLRAGQRNLSIHSRAICAALVRP